MRRRTFIAGTAATLIAPGTGSAAVSPDDPLAPELAVDDSILQDLDMLLRNATEARRLMLGARSAATRQDRNTLLFYVRCRLQNVRGFQAVAATAAEEQSDANIHAIKASALRDEGMLP